MAEHSPYSGKRINQAAGKRRAIRQRERRLNKKGTSLLAFVGGYEKANARSGPKRPDTRTDFAKHSDEFKKLCEPRMFHQSVARLKGKDDDRVKIVSKTYRKPPVDGEVKGKLARKAAKRERHSAMKEAR